MSPTITLTPQQTEETKQALMALNRLLPHLDELERCGEDCRQRRERVNRLVGELTAQLEYFGVKQ